MNVGLINKLRFWFSAIIVTFVFVFVYFMTYSLAEPKSYDFMTRHFVTQKLPFDKYKNVTGSDDIVLIVLDDNTLDKYRWPWKRELNCKILNFLSEYAKPKLVVHDSVIATLDNDNPESDRRFFDTISKFDNLVEGFIPSGETWQNREFGEFYDKAFQEKFGLNVVNKQNTTPNFYSSFMPFPKPYYDAVKHAGSVVIHSGFINGLVTPLGLDEINRNYEYIFNYKGAFYPSLALKAFTLINDTPEIILTNKALKFPSLGYEVRQVKSPYQMTSPIKFYKLNDNGYSHKKYSALEVMDSYDFISQGKKSLINPEVFKDKIVFIGANVSAGKDGPYDVQATPLSPNHPGVDIQATAFDNILNNDFLLVLPQWFNFLMAIFGMLLIYGYIRVSDLAKSVASALIISGGYFGICAVCYYFGIVINVITPLTMLVMTMILAYTHKFVIENRNKEKVKSAMGKYMSQDVMKHVVQDIDNLGLGGKKSVVTVLFADIRGFTSMSERMSAQEVSTFLNEYFSEMEPIITKYNGVINKFIGDAVMAIFGEPIQDKNHAQNGVRCAYEMLEKVKELQQKWLSEGKPKIDIGVGVNTGEVFVGNIGSINRMEYTVIGDTVNLASRLESYNKIYKTKLLISPVTYEEVKGFCDVIKISDVQIRGKANKMDIYEVLRVNSPAVK